MELIDELRSERLNDSAILDVVYPLEEQECKDLLEKLTVDRDSAQQESNHDTVDKHRD